MLVILGLVILIAAVVVGVAGVLGNSGSGHGIGRGFEVFGYHVTGSTGTLFLYGIVLGAVLFFGLSLLLAGARRTSRRARAARADLLDSRRREAAAREDRDRLIEERESARVEGATPPPQSPPAAAPPAAAPPAAAPPNDPPPADQPAWKRLGRR
ncbi:hypothetical protein ACIRP0_36130 [Streptomyces sp. NPDC101733]|uniref:hypothetical protein n=1 Tax=unclassified Streptomyces TaxID=2593676 RepID=UPI0037F80385